MLDDIVRFRPIYSLSEAASALCISEPVLKRIIDAGKIGTIINGYRSYSRWPEPRPIICITGWQLIEYIEHLENESK